MKKILEQVTEAVAAIRQHWTGTPRVGIILGTGLGGLSRRSPPRRRSPTRSCPTSPSRRPSTHAGPTGLRQLAGQDVMAMEGRFHFYEGYPSSRSRFPVRVMKALGCEVLIVSNACGGMNPQWAKGDIMLIEDHINLIGDNPLIGKNDDRLGPRFPDMCFPYDTELLGWHAFALEEKIACHKGVFVAVPGPNLETGGVSLPARHRRRRGRHVHGAGSHRRRPCGAAVWACR